jgi:pantoate--beta-alanine ligase
VHKTRSIYHLTRDDFLVEVCLDDVDGVGRFVELEIQAPEAALPRTREALMQLAAELGLSASERRSYLELLLEKARPVGPVAVVTTVAEARRAVAGARRRELTVGLVPTMGALHAGHVSLIRAARRRCGFVVVSVFVNPTQFGPNEDLSRYPRPFEQDVAACAGEGADLVFAPAPTEVYPPGFRTSVEVHEFQDVLCGASRPGHFRGVATVVLKLFNMVRPDVAFFGLKDAQQVRLLERMVADLNVPVEIVRCPTVREADGLALSSRNQYLDAGQRRAAVVLHAIRWRRCGGALRRASARRGHCWRRCASESPRRRGRGWITSPRSITTRCGR